MKRSDKPIIVEESFHKSVDSVWAAITEPERMTKWFFDKMPDFKPEIGFEVEFNVESGGRIFPHKWRVTKAVLKELLELNWKYGGYQGDSYVSFKLQQDNGSTRLKLTQIITEDFAEDVPEFIRESCTMGWNYFIKQRLKDYLR